MRVKTHLLRATTNFGAVIQASALTYILLPVLFDAGPRKSLLEQLSRTGYGHNFGEPPGGGSNVQGQLIVQILKPLLDKCVETRKELQAHENIVSNSCRHEDGLLTKM